MRPRGRLRTAVVAALSAALALPTAGAFAAPAAQALEAPGDEAFSALVFSKTAGFRHDSIPTGIAAIEALGEEHGFSVDATEDAAAFTDANLAQYDVVVWLSTTGDVLNPEQQGAFERYIQAGGGYAGIHAASDTEYDWPWYGELVGAYFKAHPQNQTATVKVEDHAHPSTDHLDAEWSRFDEWYGFQSNPRGDVHVLASLDEGSFDAGSGAMGLDHPIAWCSDVDGGRSWYTGGGHTRESYAEPEFLEHLLGGLRTAAGVEDADCAAGKSSSYEKVALDTSTQNPMELDIAPDGRVFYVERDGRVQVVDPQTQRTTTAARVPVFTGNEDGLTGLVLDPAFADNGWIYLFHSPAGTEPVNRVSRFTVGAGSTIDLATEARVIDIPVQRTRCCHAGGSLQFDKDGNLLITTGDNTNPFESGGYTPIDERAGRADFDAQRTSGNTNDLRGKVLRITPKADGGYDVPAGNLFAPGTELTRPEIYAMGFRNPFRLGVDPLTGHVMVGDYGPDAGAASPTRGPEARVEWNLITEPGNYGWPYCHSDTAYVDFDFATSQSRGAFDCDAPVNDSPNNTGLRQLPPAVDATIWYANNGQQTNAPEIGGGGAPMGGPVFRYDPEQTSERGWPAYWDGKAVFGEWNTNQLFSFQLDETASRVVDINRILETMSFKRPMDLEFGPDGALYLIEWGSGFGGDNDDSGVYRVDYTSGTRAPIASASADVTSGPAPLTVQFSSEGSRDPDGTAVTFAWDFGDGTTSTEADPVHTYTATGDVTAQLTVTDADGQTAVANVPIVVGNTTPTVRIDFPDNGGFADFGDQVRYEVTVADPEDGEVDCSRVVVQVALGHDSHAHPGDAYTGCEGVLQTFREDGHGDTADIFSVVEARYTDGGNDGASPLTGRDLHVLQPKLKQAEFFSETGRLPGSPAGGDAGVVRETTSDTAGGGQNLGYIETGDWWAYEPMDLLAVDEVVVRAASEPGGGRLEIRSGAPDGPAVGAVDVPATGGWQVYRDLTVAHDGSATGEGPLYFVAVSGGFNVNYLRFVGKGVTDNQRPVVGATGTPTRGTAPLTVALSATATDPEGDALTYRWDVGVPGAPAQTGAEASYTYTSPGTYTARVTVTDARGASTEATVQVVVEAPSAACLTGRSDDFLGTELDRSRWTTVVRENQDLRVRDGGLVLPTTKTDIYGAGAGTTPNIVLQDLPSGPFQATTKVTLPARTQYQQAGLVIYGGDEDYAKVVLQARAGLASPSKAERVVQFIREEGGNPNEVGESNSPQLGDAFPDTAYLRFTSDGSNLTASYSADGSTWTQMPQTKSLAGITDPKIGLISLAGSGERPVVDAVFDWFQITPDDTASAPGPDDEFDGTALDRCRWTVLREDASALRVAGGWLELDTGDGDIYGTGGTPPRNFLLQPQPEEDWTVETLIDGSAFDQQYQQGGLIAYAGDGDYVKLDLVTENAAGSPVSRRIELRSEVGDVVQANPPDATQLATGVWHLRLAKEGSTFTGSYSADGETWTELGTVTNALAATTGRVGLFTLGAAQQESATARFDHFRVVGDEEPPPADTTAPTVEATLDPSSPSGQGGWWTGPVTVALAATDDRPGDLRVERRVGTGRWAAYTGPVTVTADGTTVVRFRATDAAGNTSPVGRVQVRIDATAPGLEVTGLAAGGSYGDSLDLTPAWRAVDAVSGAGTVSARLDGARLQPGAALELHRLTLGAHLLVVTGTDAAGNEATLEVPFTVTTSFADVRALVERFRAERAMTTATAKALVRHLDGAEAHAAAGRAKQAVRQLDAFRGKLGGVTAGVARSVLQRDAAALTAQVREG
ncbi:ThuA domain-containing protein [Vallicoccus soli]|uniref:DUF1349 domain-containing protein n=1 Tax=Vallicoccus soli TaxID=2339232 RepID=A0A3A3YTH3_9ACTN|nr:ThuA domain-containing protein [Vallicoccus soli]RJK94774.1 DUF1349 domain-containing protein [Vallicoccus soli]